MVQSNEDKKSIQSAKSSDFQALLKLFKASGKNIRLKEKTNKTKKLNK